MPQTQMRTVGIGLAVPALIFLLASSPSHFLLVGFAIASIAWAFWSFSAQLRNERPAPQKPLEFSEAPRRRRGTTSERRKPQPANLLSFPTQEWDVQSSGY